MHSTVYKRLHQASGPSEEKAASSQDCKPEKEFYRRESDSQSTDCEEKIRCSGVQDHLKMADKTTYEMKHCQVPDVFRIPFIVSGYRRPGLSFWECIRSLLRSTNETINVWSHLLALVLFVSVNMTSLPTDDPFFLPLISFAVGISVLYFTSSFAHLFNCMSENSHRICFFFDYAAIGFYTFTAGQALFFYSRTAGSSAWAIYDSLAVFQTVSTVFSLLVTICCCASSHPRWRNCKAVLRVAILVVNWLVITSPYTVRLLLCENADPAYNGVSMVYFKRHVIFCGLGAVLYAARVPERLMTGVFDNFGQSHNLAHILIAMGIQQAFNTAQMDLQERRSVLVERFASQPTVMNTVGMAMIVLTGHVTIVLWFAGKLSFAKRKPRDEK
ncbi:membrane progestin receptor gamma-B-like [Oculina patagonica]